MSDPNNSNDSTSGYELTPKRGGELCIQFLGKWSIRQGLKHIGPVADKIKQDSIKKLTFGTGGLKSWDSSLLTFLVQCYDLCQAEGVVFDKDSLPKGVERLINLSQSVPGYEFKDQFTKKRGFFHKAGTSTIALWDAMIDVMVFFGEVVLSTIRVVSGKGNIRKRDFLVVVQEVGIEALPIVALISFLVGFILAYVGAVQLKRFGASIYVADLVGLAMVREMGAMMAAIIMSGRTGAAFAATLGSMKVTEEIDALRTSGISPIDFLVLPRLFALFLMMPLLCLFADAIGIVGGMLVSKAVLGLTFTEFVTEMQTAVRMVDVFVGVSKSTVFGALIAIAGCLRGMQCGNSSDAVGFAATSAVVTAITWIIGADALFAVLFDVLGL